MINQKQLGKKIKKLRESKELSQEFVALKLNLSRPAISQIESDQRKVDSLELKRIAKLFSMSVDELLADEAIIGKKKKVTISKLSQANKEKFKQVLLYILENCGAKPNIGETVLYKLLYFCDFDFYELYGKSLTGTNYRRINYGPAPCDFDESAKEMIKDKQLKRFNAEYYGKLQKKYIPLVNVNLDKIGIREKEIIDKVINRLSDMSASAIADYSRQDVPCDTTLDKEIIDYELVFYRTVPYSRRDYKELYEETSAKDVLENLDSVSEREYEYYKNL